MDNSTNSLRMINNRTLVQTAIDDSNHHDDVPIPSNVSLSGSLIGIVLIATGVFGNILVIFSVVLNKHLFKACNVFIISLALSDIFQNVAVKTLYIHTYVTGEWNFSDDVCTYALFASNLAILEIIIHITSIAFFRYLVIVHPRTGHRIASWKAVFIILLLIYLIPWVITLLVALPKVSKGNAQFNKRIMFCSFVGHKEFRIGGVLKKVVFLTVAALIILYSYLRIYLKSRNTLKCVRSVQGGQPLYYARIKNDLALLKTVKIIFISFVISFLPLSVLYGVDTNRDFPYWVYFLGVMLLWSSSSINWIIYFCVNRRFRRAYKNIFDELLFSRLVSLNVRTSHRTFRSAQAFSLKSSRCHGNAKKHPLASDIRSA